MYALYIGSNLFLQECVVVKGWYTGQYKTYYHIKDWTFTTKKMITDALLPVLRVNCDDEVIRFNKLVDVRNEISKIKEKLGFVDTKFTIVVIDLNNDNTVVLKDTIGK